MKEEMVKRDERTVVVENASYRLAANVMMYGLLIIVIYRGWLWNQNCMDLLALVIVGGFTATIYQGTYKVLTPGWWRTGILLAVLAAVIGAGIVFLRRYFGF